MTTNCLFSSGNFPKEDVALIQGEYRLTYGDLDALTLQWKQLSSPGGFAMLRIANDLSSVTAYVALVQSGIPVMLIDLSASKDYEQELISRFKPRFLVGCSNSEGSALEYFKDFPHPEVTELSDWVQVSGELCMLLGTSGSTGSPKFVRLSHTAVKTNASDISEALSITKDHVGITSLPPSYTYGLSVINSHLSQGACIVITDSSVTSKNFWDEVSTNNVSSFAGVPTTYTMLRQMRWSLSDYPSLKYATQAGGRLQDKDRIYFWEMFQEQSKHFIVMYGQTEATARISITPHAMLKEHISTAGIVVKSGNISIENVGPDGTGEIYFKGPNVMMGYAESKFDLSLGDIQEGELETGDLGYLKENMLFITGRTKRIVKIFGKRVSLDDVDARLTKYGRGVAVQSADKVTVFMTSLNEGFSANDIRHDLSEYLSVNIRGVDIREIDQLPLLKSGKIDTLKLQEQA